MDEKIAKYLKTYGVVAAFLILIVVLGESGFIRILTGLIAVISFTLIGAILIQQGKGGGLVGALGGMSGDTMFGTAATPIKKFTAALGLLFLVGVLSLGRAKRESVQARQAPPSAPPAREAQMPLPTPPVKVPAAPAPTPK